jgi:hypothetical protein
MNRTEAERQYRHAITRQIEADKQVHEISSLLLQLRGCFDETASRRQTQARLRALNTWERNVRYEEHRNVYQPKETAS